MKRREQEFGTLPEEHDQGPSAERQQVRVLGFVTLWSAADPEYLGAWLPIGTGSSTPPVVLGRGGALTGESRKRVVAVRQRPGHNEILPQLGNQSLSREQLEIRTLAAGHLDVKNVGRLPLLVNGQKVEHSEIRAGDVLELGSQMALLCVERPAVLPELGARSAHAFGKPDECGFVGESVAAWQLRGDVSFAAPRPGHILVFGPSGTGKELVASALHALSQRSGPFIARNAATLPEALVDAELFGNLKGYPNPGMPDRKGLIGAAHEGTLFLDEFADLPQSAQAHLLRVLDRGEFQRLGDVETRRSDFRLVAATNRPETALRSDVLARFDFHVRVPALGERRDDIPFLALHLLEQMVGADPELGKYASANGLPKLASAFVRRLIEHEYETNVRELRHLLWRALSSSRKDVLEWPSQGLVSASDDGAPELAPHALQKALDENNGSMEKTWRSLGLSSRHALARLVKKHGLRVIRQPGRR